LYHIHLNGTQVEKNLHPYNNLHTYTQVYAFYNEPKQLVKKIVSHLEISLNIHKLQTKRNFTQQIFCFNQNYKAVLYIHGVFFKSRWDLFWREPMTAYIIILAMTWLYYIGHPLASIGSGWHQKWSQLLLEKHPVLTFKYEHIIVKIIIDQQLFRNMSLTLNSTSWWINAYINKIFPIITIILCKQLDNVFHYT